MRAKKSIKTGKLVGNSVGRSDARRPIHDFRLLLLELSKKLSKLDSDLAIARREKADVPKPRSCLVNKGCDCFPRERSLEFALGLGILAHNGSKLGSEYIN